MFYYLAVIGKKSPLSIKESRQIKEVIEKYNPMELFENFQILPIEETITVLSYNYMQNYNLLPNDALILATVKHYNLELLASFDQNDFKHPCEIENIKLIGSISELE